MKRGLTSSAGPDVPREIAWYVGVRRFDHSVQQQSFMGTGNEIISRVFVPLLLFRVGQLSITGQKMYAKYWLSLRYNTPVICNHCHCPYEAGE